MARWVPMLQKAVSWGVITWGLLAGGYTLSEVGKMVPADQFISRWNISALMFGLAVIAIAWVGLGLATRNRRKAAIMYLVCIVVVLASWLVCDTGFWITPFNLLVGFVLPALFWFVTGHRDWPRLDESSSGKTWNAKLIKALAMLFVFAVALVFTAKSEVLAGSFDCSGEGPPLAIEPFPGHSTFIAKPVFRGPPYWSQGAHTYAGWGIAKVEDYYWGLPWWSRRYVLLTQMLLEKDREYFISGRRSDGFLAQFLPIVSSCCCTRSSPIEVADLDLRVLREGQPRNGARIIGRVIKLTKQPYYHEVSVSGEPVFVVGPAGTIIVYSDDKGVYDLKGLPQGTYSVHLKSPTIREGRTYADRCRVEPTKELKNGDVWGCKLRVLDSPPETQSSGTAY